MPDPRTILVTGAGSGVGRATARLLLENGWKVALTGRREAPLEETAGGHDNALVIPADVSRPDEVEALFVKVATEWGRLDALFNNAGTNVAPATIDEIPVEDWLKVVEVNLTGAFLCARAAFALMKRQDPQGGRIVNNGSISAWMPRPGSVPYTATKHAITGLTRTLALDGRPFSIACGQIDIGNAASEMTAKMSGGVPQADGSMKPEPVMDVKHVAESVLHMASLPLDANVLFMTVMASGMPYVGRG